jgi:hypothetical protein
MIERRLLAPEERTDLDRAPGEGGSLLAIAIAASRSGTSTR